MLRAISIATAIGLAAPSYAQVRVITGDVEHHYGPGGEILDDPQLMEKNQRAKRQVHNEGWVAGPVKQQRLSVQQSRPSQVPNSWWSDDAARRQPRRAGGTTMAMNRPRARGVASELGSRAEAV